MRWLLHDDTLKPEDRVAGLLFPGGQPGRPVSAYQLGQRLRQLGLHPGQARSTALFQLATDLPAAILARLLGIHITVAVAWQRAWAAYAAEVCRRGKKGRLLPMTFQDHLRQVATQAVTSISASAAHDVYVVSFLVYDEDDDPRRPTLTIGYNTETRVQQILAAQPGSELLPAGAPTDEAEARWNYAFWLQNELAVNSATAPTTPSAPNSATSGSRTAACGSRSQKLRQRMHLTPGTPSSQWRDRSRSDSSRHASSWPTSSTPTA